MATDQIEGETEQKTPVPRIRSLAREMPFDSRGLTGVRGKHSGLVITRALVELVESGVMCVADVVDPASPSHAGPRARRVFYLRAGRAEMEGYWRKTGVIVQRLEPAPGGWQPTEDQAS